MVVGGGVVVAAAYFALEEEEVRPERDARQQLKLNDELDKNRKILLHLNQWDPGNLSNLF